jgi:hypothetical protein
MLVVVLSVHWSSSRCSRGPGLVSASCCCCRCWVGQLRGSAPVLRACSIPVSRPVPHPALFACLPVLLAAGTFFGLLRPRTGVFTLHMCLPAHLTACVFAHVWTRSHMHTLATSASSLVRDSGRVPVSGRPALSGLSAPWGTSAHAAIHQAAWACALGCITLGCGWDA